MTLGGEIVNFVWLDLLHNANQAAGISHIAVVQDKFTRLDMRVLIQVVDTVRVEQRGPAFDTVYLIAFLQKKFGQIGSVLAGDTRDKRFFCHFHFVRLYLSSNRTMSSSPR